MRKDIEVGAVYSAHAYQDGERLTKYGTYRFAILARSFQEVNGLGAYVYLGLKLDVDYSPYDDMSQCFWFDDEGVHKDLYINFVLKRKLKRDYSIDEI